MKKTNNLVFLLNILLLIIIISIIYKFFYGYKDNFSFGVKNMGEYEANLDGLQLLPYVVDPTYDDTIKQNYYLNDDTKVNDARLVNHKYQIKSGPFYGSTIPPSPLSAAIASFLLRLKL